MNRRRDEQNIDLLQRQMFFRQHRIAGLKKALAANFQHVAAIMRDLIDEVGLACKDRELLVAVNCMDGLNTNSLHRKWAQRLGHNEAVGTYSKVRQFL